MNIEIKEEHVFILILLVILFITMKKSCKKQENWTQDGLIGNSPYIQWKEMPRKHNVCDTEFDDANCKYSAINCLHNGGYF